MKNTVTTLKRNYEMYMTAGVGKSIGKISEDKYVVINGIDGQSNGNLDNFFLCESNT